MPTPLDQLEQRLEAAVIAAGLLSSEQLHIVREAQTQHPQAFSRQLQELGFLPEATLRELQANLSGKQHVDLAHATFDPAALALLPAASARRLLAIPLDFDSSSRCLSIAMAQADDLSAQDQILRQLPAEIHLRPLQAEAAAIEQAIDRCYGHELTLEGILHELETGEIAPQDALTVKGEYRQPIVRLVDALLTDAVKRGASDIHFEPEKAFLRIRYRIDGLLQPVRVLRKSCWPAMTVRLKIISGMNIAEMRAPQDGRMSMTISGRAIDFRAASQPTLHGENIVLRILDRGKGIVPLAQLGLTAPALHTLQRMIARPAGIILVTGPTGSGKTTTLYSILSHINREDIHIMTLEDPVEYPMPLLRQTSVSDACKLDFANGIRSMMRQDPDVILIGEIRDAASAAMAFQAAMTGHQVYSTLHTHSAAGAFPRLLDLGIPAELMAGNIIGILAQRLLRRLCPHCRRSAPATTEELRLLGLAEEATAPTLYRPGGCTHCHFTGYRGRLAIAEVLRMDRNLDNLIALRAGQNEIAACADAQGVLSLLDDGVAQVCSGATSLAELMRVVDLSDRM